MKSHFSIVIWMLAVSMLLKMLVYAGGYQFSNVEYVYFFGNPFIIMVGIFLGIRLFKKQMPEKTTFIADVKSGMKVASMYAVLMSLFVYIYYSYIDSAYFEIKLGNQLELMVENGATPQNLKKARETGEFFLSAYFMSTVTLVGFIILGTFYSSLITFFIRKVRNER